MANMLHVRDSLLRWGVPVVEYPGWYSRGRSAGPINMRGWLWHHTGTPRSAWSRNGRATLGVIVNGRSDLRGPLANAYQGRDGAVILTAGGKANHAGRGRYGDLTSAYHMGGIEVESDGYSYTDAQRAQWPKIGAALEAVGIRIVKQPEHFEFALPRGRKWDRGSINASLERARSKAQFNKGIDTNREESGMALDFVRDKRTKSIYLVGDSVFRHLSGPQWEAFKDMGYKVTREVDSIQSSNLGVVASVLNDARDRVLSGQRKLRSDIDGLPTIEVDERALQEVLERSRAAELTMISDQTAEAVAEVLTRTVFRAATE